MSISLLLLSISTALLIYNVNYSYYRVTIIDELLRMRRLIEILKEEIK